MSDEGRTEQPSSQAAKQQSASSEQARREFDELTHLAKQAVQEAREENRRLGIPNVQVDEDGRLTEELPDGTSRSIQRAK